MKVQDCAVKSRAIFGKINYPVNVVLLSGHSTDDMIPKIGNQFSDPIMPKSRRMSAAQEETTQCSIC